MLNRQQRRAMKKNAQPCDYLMPGEVECGATAAGSTYVSPPGHTYARRFWWCEAHEAALQIELLAAGWYVEDWHLRPF